MRSWYVASLILGFDHASPVFDQICSLLHYMKFDHAWTDFIKELSILLRIIHCNFSTSHAWKFPGMKGQEIFPVLYSLIYAYYSYVQCHWVWLHGSFLVGSECILGGGLEKVRPTAATTVQGLVNIAVQRYCLLPRPIPPRLNPFFSYFLQQNRYHYQVRWSRCFGMMCLHMIISLWLPYSCQMQVNRSRI
jgi:hypothetical protein